MDITEFLKREISQNYQVNSRLGAGGCSIVYDAERRSDGRRVAIKVLSLPETLEPEEAEATRQRFCREALLMVTLHDPHIAECLDYGVFEGSPCIVLEYIDGKPLDLYLKEYGALPFDISVNIICQLLDALAVAHSIGVIHRDIKPGNILLIGDESNPSIRLIDFGIASLTQGPNTDRLNTKMGSIRGTPSYMAPELFSGFSPASPASDLYAAGLILFECLTGKIAITGVTIIEIGFKQAHQELTIPRFIPKCLAKVILKSCAKVPEQRYQTAQEMNDALKAALPEAEAQSETCAQAYMDGVKKEVYRANNSKLRNIIIALVCMLVILITIVVTRVVTRQSSSEATTDTAQTEEKPQVVQQPAEKTDIETEQAAAAAVAAPDDVIAPEPEPVQQPDTTADAEIDPVVAEPDPAEIQPEQPDPSLAEPAAALPEAQPNSPAPAAKTSRSRSSKKNATPQNNNDTAVEPVQPKPKKNTMVIPTNLI